MSNSVRDTRLAQIRRFIERVVAHLAYDGFLRREVQNALAVKLAATICPYPKLGQPMAFTAAALRTPRVPAGWFPRADENAEIATNRAGAG